MKRGIALITTILMAALLTILIGTALFIASRALFVTGGEERFASALEAAEGGIERGSFRIRKFLDGTESNLNPIEISLGSYRVEIAPEAVTAYVRSGFNLRFAAAYLGLGYSESGGAIGQIFLIASNARHPSGANMGLEALRMVPIGVKGGD
ncbi:MAG: hypothetical protein ABIN23_02850 [candidate division WOR-3 bacterium]